MYHYFLLLLIHEIAMKNCHRKLYRQKLLKYLTSNLRGSILINREKNCFSLYKRHYKASFYDVFDRNKPFIRIIISATLKFMN